MVQISISTHTPLAGRDGTPLLYRGVVAYFYSHAPRGARRSTFRPGRLCSDFYSHAPRGARPQDKAQGSREPHFYSHAPRGARPTTVQVVRGGTHFYSHAPRGARPFVLPVVDIGVSFLLTRPSRGATPVFLVTVRDAGISTHTPLAGRDHR